MKCRVVPMMAVMAALAAFATGCASEGRVDGPGMDAAKVMEVASVYKDAHLRASVKVKNEESEPLRLRYRFTWLDSTGLPVGMGTPTDNFMVISLAPYETRYIQGDAPNAEVTDFRLYLQDID